MVRICVFPNCGNKMTRWQCLSFHRLPLRDPDTLPSWLSVLQLNMQTPVHELREKDYRVCSEHFDDSDFSEKNQKDVPLKRRHLKRNAIPRAQRSATVTAKVDSLTLLFLLMILIIQCFCKQFFHSIWVDFKRDRVDHDARWWDDICAMSKNLPYAVNYNPPPRDWTVPCVRASATGG